MIIVGLGNPGPEYAHTRHNLGFVVLDAVVEKLGLEWQTVRNVMIAKHGRHVLIKPWSFMNRSGQALRDYCQYSNLPTGRNDLADQLLVVHDELDFEPGAYKQQRDRTSAGHNGVESIIEAFGTKDFNRVRIGIGSNRPDGKPAEAYVLEPIPAADRDAVAAAVRAVVDRLVETISE